MAGPRAINERLRASARYPRWVLLAALGGMFATTFPITILTVSLGDIARDLDTTETTLAWVISGPMLASALALPVLGKLGDLYGHRRVFLLGFAVATAVAAATALAWNAASLIGFRTVAQTVGAATQPASMALIMTVFAPADRVKAMGWWSLVAAGAPAVGLVLGGPTVELFGWRLIFLAQAVLALAALAAAFVVLPETTRRVRVRFDVAGSLALAAGVGGAMFALTQGAEWGWLNGAVLAAAVAAPAGIAAFVLVERRVEHPLLPLQFFERRNFTAPIVCTFTSGAAYMGGFILAPLMLRFVFGMSLSAVAMVMLLRPVSYSVSSPFGGHLATRVGERATTVAGTTLLAVALAGIGLGAVAGSLVLVCAALFLQGIGHGMARPSITASMANAVDEGDFGIAAAAQRMMHQVGAALGISLMTVVYGGVNEPGPFLAAHLVGAALAGAGAVAAWFIESTDRSTPGGGTAEPAAAEPPAAAPGMRAGPRAREGVGP